MKLAKKLTRLPTLPEFSGADRRALAAGKVVKVHEMYTDASGHKAGRGVAYRLIAAAPQAIWDAVLGVESYPEFFPNCDACRVYESKKNEVWSKYTLRVGLVLTIRYHVRHVFEPSASRMTWEMDQEQKNDFAGTTGEWVVWPEPDLPGAGGRALVRYTCVLESGRKIPKRIEDLVARSGLVKVMDALKKRVE